MLVESGPSAQGGMNASSASCGKSTEPPFARPSRSGCTGLAQVAPSSQTTGSTLRSPQILQEDARRLTPTRTTTSFASSTCVLASPPRTVPRLRPVQLHVRAPRQTSVRRYDLRNGPILGSRQPSRFHWHPRQRLAHGRRRHRLLLLRGICPQRMTSSTDRSTHRVAISTALSSGATRAGARRPLYRTRLARD
jgi:hypothetical protein